MIAAIARHSGIRATAPSMAAAAIGAAMVSVAALAAATPASAQGYFKFGTYSYAPYGEQGYTKPRKVKRSKIAKPASKTLPGQSDKKPDALVEQKPEGPLVISVSLRKQRVAVFDADGLVTEAPISSGTIGRPTPTGIFSVLEKNRIHYSNLYDSAPMPNMHRITWSGVAMHAGHLPGYPASHGCIRLPHGFSKKLFEITKVGNRVIVSNDPVVPEPFDHPSLFKAYPPENAVAHALVPGPATKVADASDVTTGTTAQILGVSTAAAAEPQANAAPEPAVRQRWRAELAQRAAAVLSTETAKTTAASDLTAANAAVDAAKVKLKTIRDDANRIATEAKKLANQQTSAEKALVGFEKQIAKSSGFTPEGAAKAAADEDKLETTALDLADAADDAKLESDEMAAVVDAAVKALAEAEADRKSKSAAYNKATADADAAKLADAAGKRRDAKRKSMVHVFVSRKTQKLYVRQGYEPILEAPVQFTDPNQPVGTHVFTALSVAQNQRDVTWNVVSIPTRATPAAETGKTKKQREAAAEKSAAEASQFLASQTPQSALQRFAIPADIRDQIEDVMKPGSSLIVSDNGLSNETGQFTDFIVPVR